MSGEKPREHTGVGQVLEVQHGVAQRAEPFLGQVLARQLLEFRDDVRFAREIVLVAAAGGDDSLHFPPAL